MFVEQGYYSTIMVDKRHEVTSTQTARTCACSKAKVEKNEFPPKNN